MRWMLLVRDTIGRVSTREKISAIPMAAAAAMRKYTTIRVCREARRSIISCTGEEYRSTPCTTPSSVRAEVQ